MNKKYLRRRNYMYEAIKIVSDKNYINNKNIYFSRSNFVDKNNFVLDFIGKSKSDGISSSK